MILSCETIIFNEEECWIAGLPEQTPLVTLGETYGWTRLVRTKCYNEFYNLLTCPPEAITDEQVARLPAYAERLRRLDDLSERMVPLIMPYILAEFE